MKLKRIPVQYPLKVLFLIPFVFIIMLLSIAWILLSVLENFFNGIKADEKLLKAVDLIPKDLILITPVHHPIYFSNLWKGLKGQLPLKRFLRNFFVTGNAWGMFHINSHISVRSSRPKLEYGSHKSAKKVADSMSKKKGVHFSVYKCVFCDGYHIGKNRDNKIKNDAPDKSS